MIVGLFVAAWVGCVGVVDSGEVADNGPDIHPPVRDCAPADEICDGIDNDCDQEIDEGVKRNWYFDRDGDGFGHGLSSYGCAPADGSSVDNDADCDDDNDAVHPGAQETCGGGDQDCDGLLDDEDPDVTAPYWYLDADFDGFGDPGTGIASCVGLVGVVPNADDCDDLDATVSPNAQEICNARDDDCDGLTDDQDPDRMAPTWFADADHDGWGASTGMVDACTSPAGYAPIPGDCDDNDAAVNIDATEVCDGVDNDCDGLVDDNDDSVTGFTWYRDSDGDGYGRAARRACVQPPDTVPVAGDCVDHDPHVHPGADEVCDGTDNNCSGLIDDDDPTLVDAQDWFEDLDRDGFGSDAHHGCQPGYGWVLVGGDCDDNDWQATPVSLWYADLDQDGWGAPGVVHVGCGPPMPAVTTSPLDCDDNDPNRAPGRCAERCEDGYDNDRDGLRDCEDPDCACDDAPPLSTCPTDIEFCSNGFDDDGDGLGDCDDGCEWHNGCIEALCANRVDDDLDGLIDCDDPDCAWACERDCSDGIDNDSDFATDCDDPDCKDPTCDERCDDGIDNDADGLLDCEDADCAMDDACVEECDNAIDDDDDGLVDCWDDDCFGPACLGATRARVHQVDMRATRDRIDRASGGYPGCGTVVANTSVQLVQVERASGTVEVADGYGGVAEVCTWRVEDAVGGQERGHHWTHCSPVRPPWQRMLGIDRPHVSIEAPCSLTAPAFLPGLVLVEQDGVHAARQLPLMRARSSYGMPWGPLHEQITDVPVANWYPAAELDSRVLSCTSLQDGPSSGDSFWRMVDHRYATSTWSSTNLPGEPFYAPAAP